MILSHNGKGHRALRLLSETSADSSQICRWLGLSKRDARKLRFMLGMMNVRGVVSRGFGRSRYEITDAGWDALAVLDSGEDCDLSAVVPSVRVFGKAA